MTAAHTTLPLPTYVHVTNLENGRTTILRVNDRGPFEKNRLIDLSYSGAQKLGLYQIGTARVEIQALDPEDPRSWPSDAATLMATTTEPAAESISGQPSPVATPAVVTEAELDVIPRLADADVAFPRPTLYLQVGAFASRDNAERLRQQLANAAPVNCSISPTQAAQQTLYRLRLGPLDSVESADRLADQIREPLARIGIHDSRMVVD
jgi:rare lipoprotein A